MTESVKTLADKIRHSQIIMIPGGFSGGDEPDGSAKFITAFFRSPEITDAVRDLLNNRDGLILGICNGFQALIKLGLVPYGDFVPATDKSPTLTFNTIGRHQSRLVHTRIASTLSPWLSQTRQGDIHTVAVSHGEGRFVADRPALDTLVRNGMRPAHHLCPLMSIRTVLSLPLKASQALMAGSLVKWGIASAAGTGCTEISREPRTSLSLRAESGTSLADCLRCMYHTASARQPGRIPAYTCTV